MAAHAGEQRLQREAIQRAEGRGGVGPLEVRDEFATAQDPLIPAVGLAAPPEGGDGLPAAEAPEQAAVL